MNIKKRPKYVNRDLDAHTSEETYIHEKTCMHEKSPIEETQKKDLRYHTCVKRDLQV